MNSKKKKCYRIITIMRTKSQVIKRGCFDDDAKYIIERGRLNI